MGPLPKRGNLKVFATSRQWSFLRRTSVVPTPRAIAFALCLVIAALMVMPLIWLVRSSFMDIGQIFISPPQWIPRPWLWSNYPEAFTTIPFLHYLINTTKRRFLTGRTPYRSFGTSSCH
jgi:ABC-type glycerol-3-phosphate transport system permease component